MKNKTLKMKNIQIILPLASISVTEGVQSVRQHRPREINLPLLNQCKYKNKET